MDNENTDEIFDGITADVKPYNPDWFDKYGHWNSFGYRVYFPDDVRKILQENTERVSEALRTLKIVPMRPIETRSLKIKHWNDALDAAIKAIKNEI